MRMLSAVAIVLLSLSGCAAPDDPGPPRAPSTTQDTSSPGTLTVSGTVQPGVEAGCLILQAENASYLLVGGKGLKPGAKVKVRGHIEQDAMSFCQQGTPFVVESVRPG